MCYYCDFHFSISLKLKKELLKALEQEIVSRRNYLNKETINTIYFGGGTPSILEIKELETILNLIHTNYSISNDPEITLEANPDDLKLSYLRQLKEIGFNRLSIGIQSFEDDKLKQLNRRHTADEAIDSIKNAQKVGFDNINIDLIYGLPGLSGVQWLKNLHKAFDLNIQHISAYHLGIEPKTAFSNFVKKGKIVLPKENESLEQFNILLEEMEKTGFIHYEISNFGKENFYSKHNTNYWLQQKYIGIGPSAHSFNLISRQWNIANNVKYIELVKNKQAFYEEEILTKNEKYNDYILTSLRTMWGTDLNKIETDFGIKYLKHCQNESEIFIQSKHIVQENEVLFLTKSGKFIADKIVSDLFKVNP